ncbi:hypothetical protein CRENBAI_006560 [Crenichthys baileyi]|uniref:Uncharacterized protein n=1 Tax=Crenichthys baileyi TaxID=28760 RepID=A0AAV9RG65_9TELE
MPSALCFWYVIDVNLPKTSFVIHLILVSQSVIFYRLFHSGSRGSWCLSPAVYGQEAGYTLDRSPVHRRATQTTMHTLIHTPKGNLERPINLTGMSLDCGRKPESPVRTHTCTGRTCKLHAERPSAGNRTHDLAARQQCHQLRHRAAHLILFPGNNIAGAYC